MYVIPAVDLRAGKCVRLIQGQYHRQITYQDDPVAQARQFAEAGAQWLHIVDLDGAKVGKPVNTDTIAAVVKLNLLRVQVGGGLREEDDIRQLLDLGVQRVIVGTKAVSDFEWFSRIARKFEHKIVLGLDARGSTVATHGWTQDSPQTLIDFAKQAAQLPVAAIVYTDISKDGMMAGPNFERTKALIDAVDVPVIASGGVKDPAEIRKLAELGAEAVIIGRSLYEGVLDLAQAIKAATEAVPRD